MNPLLKTPIAPAVPANNPEIIHAVVAASLLPEDEMTLEALDRRAHYVGPVLEGILLDMESHGQDYQDWER